MQLAHVLSNGLKGTLPCSPSWPTQMNSYLPWGKDSAQHAWLLEDLAKGEPGRWEYVPRTTARLPAGQPVGCCQRSATRCSAAWAHPWFPPSPFSCSGPRADALADRRFPHRHVPQLCGSVTRLACFFPCLALSCGTVCVALPLPAPCRRLHPGGCPRAQPCSTQALPLPFLALLPPLVPGHFKEGDTFLSIYEDIFYAHQVDLVRRRAFPKLSLPGAACRRPFHCAPHHTACPATPCRSIPDMCTLMNGPGAYTDTSPTPAAPCTPSSATAATVRALLRPRPALAFCRQRAARAPAMRRPPILPPSHDVPPCLPAPALQSRGFIRPSSTASRSHPSAPTPLLTSCPCTSRSPWPSPSSRSRRAPAAATGAPPLCFARKRAGRGGCYISVECGPGPETCVTLAAVPAWCRLQDGKFCPTSQPAWSAYREPTFGHGVLDLVNRTHATWRWVRTMDIELGGDTGAGERRRAAPAAGVACKR